MINDMKKIRLFLLLAFGLFQISRAQDRAAQDGTRDTPLCISVSARARGKALDHFWSFCAGAGRANEGLRAAWLEQLGLAHRQCGFRYLRFHGLFHDDMFAYHEENGQPIFNWQYIDELFDRMLRIGVRPFVELGFFPKDISAAATCFWWGGHGKPPADFGKWDLLVDHFLRHCMTRYGRDEVHKWYFEVWNEPNLGGFWDGTEAQYFELYKETSAVIKAVDSTIRVGGPATSSYHPDQEVYDRLKAKNNITAADFIGVESHGPWIVDFLAFCEKENLSLDFISSHPYPTTYPIDAEGKGLEMTRPVASTAEDIGWLRKTIAQTRYANAQIQLTEWSSSPSPRDYTHDYPQEATYVVRANLQCVGLTNSLSYWTFTDVFEEGGAGSTIFHGGFGLINFQGIVKPAFHAYRMLNELEDEELFRWDGGIVTRSAATGAFAVLFCHYPKEVIAAPPLSKGLRAVADATLNTGSPRTFRIRLTDLRPGTPFTVEILDRDHGWALGQWEKMGSPEPPDRKQTEQLKIAAWSTWKENIRADAAGVLDFHKTLSPWAVVLIKQSK